MGGTMNKENFTKGVERLINPIDVGTIHFIQSFNNYIPKKFQKKMVNSSGNKTPYMGFVVEPYSFFLFYEIIDIEHAKTFLPEGFRIAKTKVFEGDEPKHYGIFGCFNAHTSGFWGSRVEFYIIAENTSTGLLSWIIVDYDTNTITYDPKNGFSDPSAVGSVITIDYKGEVFVDMVNKKGRKLIFNSNINTGKMKPLDQKLWIEGNLSIAYGKNKIEDEAGLFSLIFDPKEFEKALCIPRDSLSVHANDWFPGLFKDEPTKIVCFPYAQHFLSDSPGHSTDIKSQWDLIKVFKEIDFDKINVFSTNSFKTMFLVGAVISILINTILLLMVILKQY